VHTVGETAGGQSERPKRRRGLWEVLYGVFGPAQVQGALQGHSPEAQQEWKRQVAERKRIREQEKRARNRAEGKGEGRGEA
jgi:hypothetical protein